jgi:4-hydroxy-tetrahydrodipicolinate synthase
VGIGDNCFANSAAAAAGAFSHGADAVVAQLPSYYPLKPDEMFAYHSSLADRLAGPLFLYNIPMTTHMSIPVLTGFGNMELPLLLTGLSKKQRRKEGKMRV